MSSIAETRSAGNHAYREWPSHNLVMGGEFIARSRADYPHLGSGFVVPVVEWGGEEYLFTIDWDVWQQGGEDFNRWFYPGSVVSITGELYRQIKGLRPVEPEEFERPFVGYQKPLHTRAHVKSAYLRIDDLLTPDIVLPDGNLRAAVWANCEFAEEGPWRVKFDLKNVNPDLVVAGQTLEVAYNRRIDVDRFIGLESLEDVPF